MSDRPFRPPSFWLAALGESIVPRPPLAGESTVDVAIVGAGYTGLWTAYYLATRKSGAPDRDRRERDRGLRRVGAQRRLVHAAPAPASTSGWRGPKREQAPIASQRAMFDTVDEVGRVAAAEKIHCDYAKGGFLTVATSEPECERFDALLAELHRCGFSEADYRWLDASECDARVRIAGALGAARTRRTAQRCSRRSSRAVWRERSRGAALRSTNIPPRARSRRASSRPIAEGCAHGSCCAARRATRGVSREWSDELLPLHA